MQIAALLLALYGTAVLVNALVLQTLIGWHEWKEFPRAVIRFFGMGLIAWGLLKGYRWAWWFAVLLPSFFVVFGTAAVITFFAMGADAYVQFPPGFLPLALGSAVALTTAVVLLLQRTSRVAFRRPAA